MNHSNVKTREVWADNLEEEMGIIREVILHYPYVAMDTEFPGVVARPVGTFKDQSDFHYQTLRCNVDMLKLIQLGLTFTDARGHLAQINGQFCIWQFNFREFSLKEDVYARDSIELLKHSGIDFIALEIQGIDVRRFGELLMVSGVVLNDDVRWITFHSGYDFGYLLKLLTCTRLPENESDFFELLYKYFPQIFDIKYMMKCLGNIHGGLNKLADTLQVERIGQQHQAGSDSLLTAFTFFKLLSSKFSDEGVERFTGILYGLGRDSTDSDNAN